MWAKSRKYPNSFKRPWGGVLTLANDAMDVDIRDDLSAPDLMVFEVDDLSIVNAYILPEQSSFYGWAEYDPWQKFTETMALLQLTGKGVIGIGDINARTAAEGGSDQNPRTSADADKPMTTRGRALVRLCDDHHFEILNGNASLGPKNCGFTSFQPQGDAVVDYVIANATAIARIKSFEILDHDGTKMGPYPTTLAWSSS
ncbi:hypothetical protein DFH09DRAFT_1112737 [Mycena vulgaris]|nr:hypothetical protein DFH09DRAFT_1112737 [Mycena vulgaris]